MTTFAARRTLVAVLAPLVAPRRVAAALITLATLLSLVAGAPCARAASVADDLARLQYLNMRNQWPEVEALADSMVKRFEHESRPDSLAMAEALYQLASARYGQGIYFDGTVERAVSRSLGIRRRHLRPNDPRLGDTEGLLGDAYFVVNQMDSALVHARRGLDIRLSQPAPNDTLLANSWFDVGQMLTALGDGRASLDALEHCLGITKRLYGDHDNQVASVLDAIADAWQSLGQYERYRDTAQQALDVLDRSGQPDDALRSSILSRLLDAYHELGDLSRAFDTAEAGVRAADAAGDSTDVMNSRFNLAIILREFGDDAGAKVVLSRLLPLYVSHFGDSHATTGRLRQTLGFCCEATGDTALAMQLYRRSEQDLLANPEPQGSTVAMSVSSQATLLHAQKRDREALPVCERAVDLSRAMIANPAGVAVTRYTRFQVLAALRDTAALDAAQREFVALRDSLGIVNTRAGPASTFWLAYADRALGHADAAWNEARAADDAARRGLQLAARTLPDDRALQLTRENTYILNQVIDLADDTHPARWMIAWDHLVRTRGLVRAELASRRLPAGLAGDTALVRLHDGWVTAQRALARTLVRGVAASADSAARAALEHQRAAAQHSEADYARALLNRGLDTTRVEVGVADVLARLAPGQTLAAFTEVKGLDGKPRVLAFVAHGGKSDVARVPIGRSDSLLALIAPWRERLAEPPGPGAGAARAEAAARKYGALVRERVWDRIASQLGASSELILVPDGPLVDLPWNALPVGSSGYLVESGPRLRLLDAERELVSPPAVARGTSLLAVGEPDFDLTGTHAAGEGMMALNTLRASPDPCAADPLRRFPPLPGTGAEVTAVAATWQADAGHTARTLRGADATEAAFKRLAPGSTVIHLATHGVVTGDSCRSAGGGLRGVGGLQPIAAVATSPAVAGAPAASSSAPASPPAPLAKPSPWMGRRVWLALAGAGHAADANRDDDDGLLTADEVVTLDLAGTEWVVLSACHSGLAETWASEGTLGMRRAFGLAGARSVIASQWAVADEATVSWMRTLYEVRASGETHAGAAVAATCRHMLAERRRAKQSTHPFYWAAFTATGE